MVDKYNSIIHCLLSIWIPNRNMMYYLKNVNNALWWIVIYNIDTDKAIKAFYFIQFIFMSLRLEILSILFDISELRNQFKYLIYR